MVSSGNRLARRYEINRRLTSTAARLALCLVGLFAISAHADSPATYRDWPTFGNGPAHTGYQPVTLGSALYQAGWSVSYSNVTNLNPVSIENGIMLVTSISSATNTNCISALDANTGIELWRQTNSGRLSAFTPPTLAGGRVYVENTWASASTNTPTLQCLDAATGNAIWTAPIEAPGGSPYYAPVVVDDGVWTPGGNFGGLYGFDTANGNQRFLNESLDNGTEWTPAYYNGLLYTWISNSFRAHDPVTGNILWSVSLGNLNPNATLNTVPAIDGGFAFVASPTNLYAVNLTAQSSPWSVAGQFWGTPAVADGIVYIIARPGVQAYSATTGALLGTYATGDDVGLYGQPLVTIDTVIVSSSSHTYIFDRATYALRQTIPLGGQASLANNVLYLSNDGGAVHSYYPASQPTADLAISQSVSPAQIGYGSSVYVTLTATNNGPTTATAATALYKLPGVVLNYVGATTSQGSCAQEGSSIVWTVGDIPSGGSATATLQLTSTLAGHATISNTATISSTVYDPSPANNTGIGPIVTIAATATTQVATNITATSATLNGLLNPQGGPMPASFGYTPFTGGAIFPPPSTIMVAATPAFVTSNTSAPVSANISGLQPGTTYTFFVFGGTSNLLSNVKGSPLNFTTLPASTTLSNLQPSAGTLSPSFDSATYAYIDSVSNATAAITLTPTTFDSTATVTVNGVATTSGNASNSITLAPGVTSIPVIVTAADGQTSQTYTVTVTRRSLLQDWASGAGLPDNALDPLGDFNGDGLKNILKWAFLTGFGSAPLGPIQVNGNAINGYGTPVLLTVPNGSGGLDKYALFGRRVDATGVGLTYTVEFSADLSIWIPSTDTPTIVATDGTLQAVTVPFPPLVNGVPPKYFHVKVTGQ
ncbi:Pyrrolo-quinoline quinone [Chthoniobacter flavus Ellin428]|uniref:Pyrrolo-quinoline quinone n=1 Tax=Chthoniobacter flavus Ellin428 TaxID=497964 RepID=B4D622_9BACT|nr:PQQ-binding-like beta-propeller repeat protein [Chthoniobacter flavus]EDY18225.1 Pyrrolo-quinoline quinone [Chthoniobacter flavus Ellin428]TCO91423.1 uncharacterized protein DUF11 [Chthoniobacter flavus]